MFVFPGVQMSALGMVFVAAAAPLLTTTRALSLDEISLAAPRSGRHFARTRVMAAASRAPAAAPPRAPAHKTVLLPELASDPGAPPQRMVFGDDLVDGSVVGPDGEIIRTVPQVVEPSLIELRRQFVPEMLKTLEDL